MSRTKILASALAVAAGIVSLSIGTQAYTTQASVWATAPVPFYVNPANQDVSAAAATSALQAGMNAWNTQSGTWFRFSYAGQVNDTTTSMDGRNVIIFRNSSNPNSSSAVATTYTWSSNGTRIDADIIFWDGAYKLFTGSSGCDYGAYIEDIATHELGHALGLNHSSVSDATMYAQYRSCQQVMRTLASDDITGARALYPGSPAPTNTAPTVTVLSPASSSSFAQGTAVQFSGSASDAQDGSIGNYITWSSNIDGALGTGANVSKALSAGSHTVTARVSDSGGMSSSKQVAITVTGATPAPTPTPSPSPGTATLSAHGYRKKGSAKVDLAWASVAATTIDVYRNNTKVLASAPNDGSHTDAIGKGAAGEFTYRVCPAGSGTGCSNNASASF